MWKANGRQTTDAKTSHCLWARWAKNEENFERDKTMIILVLLGAIQVSVFFVFFFLRNKFFLLIFLKGPMITTSFGGSHLGFLIKTKKRGSNKENAHHATIPSNMWFLRSYLKFQVIQMYNLLRSLVKFLMNQKSLKCCGPSK